MKIYFGAFVRVVEYRGKKAIIKHPDYKMVIWVDTKHLQDIK
jgi:hypothetical protein